MHFAKISQSIAAIVIFQLIISISAPSNAQSFRRQKQLQAPQQQDNVEAEMQVVCQSDAIVLMVNTNYPFNGMLYAKDASSNNNCISEFHSATNMTFRLPLKSCATNSAEVDDGIEYFNTVIVQPHMRLMTNQGKGYHIRCKYQTRERTIANTQFNVSAAFSMQNGPQSSASPLLATASMPMCTMKIYRIDQDNVAESVKVGDKLVMVIEIDKQDMYGMRVTNCVVRDGMNKAEQQLINEQGCSVDETIMSKFDYESNNTRAAVAFKAHKFPHTSSVYYQCNVRLCINNGACEPINCQAETMARSGSTQTPVSAASSGGARQKRFAFNSSNFELEPEGLPEPSELRASKNKDEMSFDVYSGLYVSDISDMAESNAADPNGQQVLPSGQISNSPGGAKDESSQFSSGSDRDSCLTLGKAGILVIIASLSSVTVVLLIACQAGLIGGGDSLRPRSSAAPSRNFHDQHLQYSRRELKGTYGSGAIY